MADALPDSGARSVPPADGAKPRLGKGRFNPERLARAQVAIRRRGIGISHPASRDIPYSDDEWEFIAACKEFSKRSGNPFPTFSEVLFVAKSLGYIKVPHGYKLVPIETDEDAGGHTKPESKVTTRTAGRLRVVNLD